MPQEDSGSGIDYRRLVQEALTTVVRGAMRQVAAEGLPGDHHFLITFRTDWPGVELSSSLARKHPQEMTIVIQHQYWNLEVADEAFSVTLRFGGAPQRLTVPFAALTTFVDPSVPFGLRLMGSPESEDGAEEEAAAPPPEERADTAEPEAASAAGPSPRGGSATVVSLEAFKKRD